MLSGAHGENGRPAVGKGTAVSQLMWLPLATCLLCYPRRHLLGPRGIDANAPPFTHTQHRRCGTCCRTSSSPSASAATICTACWTTSSLLLRSSWPGCRTEWRNGTSERRAPGSLRRCPDVAGRCEALNSSGLVRKTGTKGFLLTRNGMRNHTVGIEPRCRFFPQGVRMAAGGGRPRI